ncbi:WYL domain-containing protein [Conexibacter stalactiti]|uniref:WYL domain-containing protein n=1 Tax=Conexibacter stalactiti TaxID=1940611 RepID=A0ABU4HQ78_9ACTN|nr:WYL domain-containing protein [Conexibacter stalactiti]MDW5595468.1 WYL domain-containing protein [Conexibacter stalactiti]MEC5036110.1 WYL domain-containing protein [Conexibacter stalactiti]
MSIPTSSRLLALLSLLQQRREWSGPELAERLDVGPRTIRRDVDKLRGLGYPIEAAPGMAGGYRLGAGTHLPPLLLDDAEAVAVAVGLRSAASGSISGTEETALRALAKLEQLLPGHLRRRVRALGDATSAFGADAPPIDADLLAVLAGACRDAVGLRFAYGTPDGRASRRHAEPCALVHSGARWYLVAFDLDRDDWRTFRVDRIAGTPSPSGRAPRRTVPGGDPAAFVETSLNLRGESPAVPGRVRVHAPAAEVSPRVPARYATVTPEPGGGTCVVTSNGRWSRQFLVWMTLLDLEINVLDPPALVADARVVATRLAASVDA